MKKISITLDNNMVVLNGIGNHINNIPQIHFGLDMDSDVHTLRVFGESGQFFLHIFKDVKTEDKCSKVIVNYNTSGKMESAVGFCNIADADLIAKQTDLILSVR